MKTSVESRVVKLLLESRVVKTLLESRVVKLLLESRVVKTQVESRVVKLLLESRRVKTLLVAMANVGRDSWQAWEGKVVYQDCIHIWLQSALLGVTLTNQHTVIKRFNTASIALGLTFQQS